MSRRRPSIIEPGRLIHDGDTVTIADWAIGLCATACPCHRDPVGGGLTLYQDQTDGGRLGLFHHEPADCDCCDPWTAAELAAVLRDLAVITELDTA